MLGRTCHAEGEVERILKYAETKKAEKTAKRFYIIEKCYGCFVKNGIENTTTRDFCAAANVNANTLYYYFESKNQILIECVNHGYRQLENVLFDALKEFDRSQIGLDYAPQMRFLHQAVSSPAYEEHRENQFQKVHAFYDRLGRTLAERFECPHELIEGYIHEIMTLLSYYTLWGSRDMAALQFNRIFTDFKDTVNSYKKIRANTE